MLRDRVEQLLNNPGANQTITPGAATPGMRTFVSAFGSGQDAYYTIDGGDMWETGWLRTAAGPPETLSRVEVISNSIGTTAKLDFTGACVIYNTLPALRTLSRADLASEKSAREAAITAVNTALAAETKARTDGDAGLGTFITNVDTKINNVNASIRTDYYASDVAFYQRISQEQQRTPYLQAALLFGAWPNTNYDPGPAEVTFFDVNLPVGARKILVSMHTTIYAPGPAGAFATGVIFKCYALLPNGQWLIGNQPQAGMSVISGTQISETHPIVLELPYNAPAGCLLRFTALRPDGNATCNVVKYLMGGHAIVGGP